MNDYQQTRFRKFLKFILSSIIIISLIVVINGHLQERATAQQAQAARQQFPHIPSLDKLLIEDAIQLLQNGNPAGALADLNLANSTQLANMSSIQLEKLLIEDAIQLLQNSNPAGALADLNLANQRISTQQGNVPAFAPPKFVPPGRMMTNSANNIINNGTTYLPTYQQLCSQMKELCG